MVQKEGNPATTDRHLIIIVVLAILFLGSLTSSLLFIFSGGEGEMKEVQKASLPAKQDEELLTGLQEEKQRWEAEKVALEKEKQALQEKKASLEKQLIGEIEARPVFNVDKDSPFDHVKDSQVRVLPRKVEIDLEGVSWWTIQDTNSMDPLLDIGSVALSVEPESEESVHVGDVALYDSLLAKTVIIHRVIKIGADPQGWYSHFKGDNLEEPDPENVRLPQIKGVVVGIIY